MYSVLDVECIRYGVGWVCSTFSKFYVWITHLINYTQAMDLVLPGSQSGVYCLWKECHWNVFSLRFLLAILIYILDMK